MSLPCAPGPEPRSARGSTEYWTRLGRSGTGVDHPGWICRRSGSGSVVVIQQSAETLTSFHFPALTDEFRLQTDQLVAESLVVAFAVVVHDEFSCRTSDRGFAKQD